MSKKKNIVDLKPGLLQPSYAYKPFRYPWAFEFWKRQQQVHWMPEEVPMGEDCKDWAVKLNDGERNLLTQIFRFFTQSDVEVNDNYTDKYGKQINRKRTVMVSYMYPHISPENDPRNIGYTCGSAASTTHFEIIPNKMNSFWDTRRGKRYINYISYRKRRDTNRKGWLKMHPPKFEKKVGAK